MTTPAPPEFGSAFARLSTGVKMLIILSTALLPLGLIALFASLQTAQANRASRAAALAVLARESAAQLDAAITRATLTLRTAGTVLGDARPSGATCRRVVDALARSQPLAVRFAVFDADGRTLCAPRGFRPAAPAVPDDPAGWRVTLTPAGTLRLVVTVPERHSLGIAEFPAGALAGIAHPSAADGSYRLVLRQGALRTTLADFAGPALGPTATTAAPVASGQMQLELALSESPVTATEVLTVLLPILMWVAAALIGWLVLERLVLRPLVQLQEAIAAYRDGDPNFRPPRLTTPAIEIRQLGDAFAGVAHTVTRHEAELEEGIARQMRLTREVHHRVKNNLQVVASLLNLHARGATSSDVAAAYAAIQRRVDALAVVHRNHYAELEENRGVALRPLIGELAANLRASAPPEAAGLSIGLSVAPFHAHQDVAVPVAFLITELVELAILCAPDEDVRIALAAAEQPLRATLTIASPALLADACEDRATAERFRRVVEGLARQLRAPLVRDEDAASFAIEISVLP